MFDVVVIGGSYAGLSAALQLGRARKKVLVVDGGQRRNRTAAHAHGFLGRDGESPARIAEDARRDVRAYPTVAFRDGHAEHARAIGSGFEVQVGGEWIATRRILLAMGVVDTLPAIEGLAERWGHTVAHCPYCHGYELDRGRLGVLATPTLPHHLPILISEWSEPGGTTLFLQGTELAADALAALDARKIRLEKSAVVRIEGPTAAPGKGIALVLADGRKTELAGLFVPPKTHIPGTLVDELGCALAEGPMGPYVKVDDMKVTSVPGVFACGDLAMAAGTVALAVADGARAGASVHQSLVFRPA
ncbi:MAG: NAD(P)/FAD-dependent oxidoreductase [Polyangiaceae bacterium]